MSLKSLVFDIHFPCLFAKFFVKYLVWLLYTISPAWWSNKTNLKSFNFALLWNTVQYSAVEWEIYKEFEGIKIHNNLIDKVKSFFFLNFNCS